MTFEKFFQFISYAAVFCGFLSLWVSGTFGVVGTGLFLAVMLAAWFLEGTPWQISERIGTALIVLALPGFYFAWKFQFFSFSSTETAIAGILARMILSLTSIKLLQRKSGRDWIFLYLMSFFEVLLAAGLSISALYLGSFLLYLVVTVCAIIAFEIRRTSELVNERIGTDVTAADATRGLLASITIKRLPAAALTLILFTVLLALPMFFALPRVGGAGMGGNQGGLSTSSGFSDTVALGGIGRIQQNDAVVMRVRNEGSRGPQDSLYLRGIALDKFDNRSWSRSKKSSSEPYIKGEKELIQFDYATGRDNLTIQTIYLEPLDTPILFGVPRVVAIKGNFPVLYRDGYGAITFQRNEERISYTVLSDRSQPPASRLRNDDKEYQPELDQYLRLPENLDPRIADLAAELTVGLKNRYDKAAAIENHLQNAYGYTLEQKAGGDEPLSDFLFNVREGHCEYFATAMAVMLRTQGLATRIVNGFSGGEYNDTADVTVVRQRNAHAWVEVYFPRENAWVTFDPTPFAGQGTNSVPTGIMGSVGKYIDALETFWIQYFVAYDNQEQASLARTVRRGFYEYQNSTSEYFTQAQAKFAEWWKAVRGDNGVESSMKAVGTALGYILGLAVAVFLIFWLYRRAVRLNLWRRIWNRLFQKRNANMVEFYDTMIRILENNGLLRRPHQTPLEFADATGLPEVIRVTELYHGVRFGNQKLAASQSAEIMDLLGRLAASTYVVKR
ncbi:MAG: DUF3488 domain-containing protein [Pyrinomonadaceae bacterium]|nr:DUF3488 domain-containing protein [Pyrinomonadaceae bacterium]